MRRGTLAVVLAGLLMAAPIADGLTVWDPGNAVLNEAQLVEAIRQIVQDLIYQEVMTEILEEFPNRGFDIAELVWMIGRDMAESRSTDLGDIPGLTYAMGDVLEMFDAAFPGGELLSPEEWPLELEFDDGAGGYQAITITNPAELVRWRDTQEHQAVRGLFKGLRRQYLEQIESEEYLLGLVEAASGSGGPHIMAQLQGAMEVHGAQRELVNQGSLLALLNLLGSQAGRAVNQRLESRARWESGREYLERALIAGHGQGVVDPRFVSVPGMGFGPIPGGG